jgi:hypothetical protein
VGPGIVGLIAAIDVIYLPPNTVSRCNCRIETSVFSFTRQATA